MSTEHRLPLEATGAQLEDAIRKVQGRARTNVLDEPAARALVGVAMHQWTRVIAAAEALALPAGELQPRGTWCQTTRYGYDGVHTVLELLPYGWRVRRGPVGGGVVLGPVSLTLPAWRGAP